MTLFLGSVAVLAAAGDVRMLVRGGVFGAQRVARHLWRMCFGLFIATGSFLGTATSTRFPGRTKNNAPGCPAIDPDDFLANPRSLQKCIQEKVGARQWRCSLVADLDFVAFRGRRKPNRDGRSGPAQRGISIVALTERHTQIYQG